MKFAKGHGTENDFVLLPDLTAAIDLTPAAVAALCDRRRGLGADGLLRVTIAGAARDAGVLEELPEGVSADDWFMDYRNGDGSPAQMCGNGVRVFAHYLWAHGLERRRQFVVGSLAGPRPVELHDAGALRADVTVEMGKASQFGSGSAVVGGRRFAGVAVDVGNPHLACVDAALTDADLAALDVAAPVSFDASQFPEGVNVEVLTAPVDGAVTMRVHERGVGETRSCGTGTVAAAFAALQHDGRTTGTLRVRVPGGEVAVTITDAASYLRGPSVLVADGELSDAWWRAQ
ncbi:diaminopimelate epimerase [Mycolicibacterium hippocampi]|uniref:Diaminopimelate epimerase n=1 Tax=Mycolicibacterium hippocampi TaxID=659824 RepID=A0A850PRG3_9MYCO|nr:Diaminopimelate epimerase [Mycolicibacterium hippocampi]